MAFTTISVPRKFGGRAALTTPSVRTDKADITTFRIPRAMLRDAGLPDFPSAKLDILIGTGPDRGAVAVVAGERITAINQGSGKNCLSVAVCTRGVGSAPYAAASVLSAHAHRGQLVLTLPVDFPLASEGDGGTGCAQPTTYVPATNGQALAA